MNYENERLFAEKTANVFLRSKSVEVSQGESNIAYCNTKTKKIYFDFPSIFKDKDDILNDMMVFKGLGFHEIMHLKFTTRHKLSVYQDQNFVELLQQLEDGRIETLGVIAHEKLADYFIYAVNEVLLKQRNLMLQNKNDSILSGYILCYGRAIYFQDMKLLALMRKLIIAQYGKEMVEKIESSVDKYTTETKSEERLKIAKDLFDFLGKNKVNSTHTQGDVEMDSIAIGKRGGYGIEISSVMDNSKDDNKEQSKEMKEITAQLPKLEKVKKDIKDELEKESKDTQDGKSGRDKFIKEKEDKISQLKKEKAEAQKDLDKELEKAQPDNKEVADKRKEINDLNTNIGLELGKGYSPDSELRKLIKNIVDEISEIIKEKEDEQENLLDKNKTDLVEDLKSIGQELELLSDNTFSPSVDMENKAKELENGLKKMNNELVKGYVSQNKSGRLNIRSVIQKTGKYGYLTDTKVFNKWTPDKLRQTKMLVNIFFDGSGSMSGENFNKALKTCWVINEALNKDENKTMIYEFSSNFLIAKEYDTPLTTPLFIGQGTNPAHAIKNALPKIEAYKKAKGFTFVVDIVITDGHFDTGESDTIIEKLNKLGHETILIGVGYGVGNNQTHNAKHVMNLNNFDELVGGLIKTFSDIKKALVMRAKAN